MKKLFFFLFLLFSTDVFAGHIAGGEIYYKYLGPGSTSNSSTYSITLRLFRECVPHSANAAPLPISVLLNIYNNTSPSTQYGQQLTAPLTGAIQQLSLTTPNPCITNPPSVCYQIGNYTIPTIELPNTAAGYIVTFQTCCRAAGITNMQGVFQAPNSTGLTDGATFTCEIPGTNQLTVGNNSSAVFALKDTTLVCNSSPFKLDFSATDPDSGDSLSYAFCAAYDRGTTTNSASNNYSSPPYNSITYVPGFSGSQPLGPNVTIDPSTGIISGHAPVTGEYIVTVCITEWRNKTPISNHRKDFLLIVSDCQLTSAQLKPAYVNCDSMSVYFQNQASSPVTSYLWDFGEKNSSTSTQPTPTHQYQDTGTYVLKLKVTNANGCQDSTNATVKIYPGFTPQFNIKGSCYFNPYQFHDATIAKYGVVNSWRWNFGDSTTLADTATSKDSAWKYPAPMNAKVRLVVSSSKGCIDSTTQVLTVSDKPTVNLPFRDTLICSIDTLALKVNTANSATINWMPNNAANQSRILLANTANPLVFPKDTTSYIVTINDNGCVNSDSVKVNVLNYITVQLGPDTTICATDSITLLPISYALSYQWSPVYALNNATIKNPVAKPLVDTTYRVVANLGKCQANAQLRVKVVPYPVVSILSPDTAICYGNSVTLHASSNANVFSWSPAASMILTNTLNPVAGPGRTTQYVLTARDTSSGKCPKPVSDTVLVIVIPPMTASAGSDTSVLADQPLQLNATGSGSFFSWSPSTWLDNPRIANPIATIPASVDSIRYKVRVIDSIGCYEEDMITVRVYKTGPEIFVPSAFSPNGDGRNDILKPIIVGIRQLLYFRIYNRWGQLLFSTSETGKGWDGNFNGVKQASGTYVYETQGTDYTGKNVFRKGTVVLIR